MSSIAQFIEFGLTGLEQGAFDCLGIAGLTLLKLYEQDVATDIIELFTGTNEGNLLTSHCFVVVGRAPSTNPNEPLTWNDQAIILDPWYGVVAAIYTIKGDSDFFKRYPLLLTDNREAVRVHWPLGISKYMDRF